MAQYLLTAPKPRVIGDPRRDKDGNQVFDEQNRAVVDVREVVHPFRAYDMALQTVTSGPKLFEVWNLRKRIKEVHFPEMPLASAKYLILSEEEKTILIDGFKTVDWTLGQKNPFWVEWEELFDSIRDIAVFDEKNPPAAYVTWRLEWEKQQAEREAARAEAERKALAEAEAAKIKRDTAIKALADAALSVVLADRVAAGKLGAAATIDDLPADVKGDALAAATLQYDADPAKFDAAPATPETTPEAPVQETDGVIEGQFTPAAQ